MPKTLKDIEDLSLGMTVLGERGQVVIPKEIRATVGLEVGDKLIALAPHDHALVLVPIKKAKDIMEILKRRMSSIEKEI